MSGNSNNDTAAAPKRGKRKNPFQSIPKRAAGGRGELDKTEEAQLIQEFVEYNRELAKHGRCKDQKSSWTSPVYKRCTCLAILLRDKKTENEANDKDDNADNNNSDTVDDNHNCHKDLFLYAVATFQLQFGLLSKRQQQSKVMDWMRYAMNLGTGSDVSYTRPQIFYMLPYLAPNSHAYPQQQQEQPLLPDNYRQQLQPLFGHKICKDALCYLLGIASGWWNTARDALIKDHALPKVHGSTNPPIHNRQKRFLQEEEPELRAFLEQIQKELATPSKSKKKGNDDDNNNKTMYHYYYNLDPAYSKRYCYKLYCAQRGKQVHVTSDGCTKVSDMPNFTGQVKPCLSWAAFHRYWQENFPRLRHKS